MCMPLGFWPGGRGATAEVRGWPDAYCCTGPARKNRNTAPSVTAVRALPWCLFVAKPMAATISCALLHWTRVDDHPQRAELIAQHAEAECEKRLFHRHENLASIGEQFMNPLGFFNAVHRERQIGAAHWLESLRRNIGRHEIRIAKSHLRVKNVVLQFGRNIIRARLLAVGHEHADLSTQVFFVKLKSFPAIAAIVEKRIQLHTATAFVSYSSWRRTKSIVRFSFRPLGARSRIINAPIHSSGPR